MERSDTCSRKKTFLFQLFVAGDETHSRIARDNLKAVCEDHLPGCHEIQVVNVLERPDLALERNVFVTPALIKLFPEPQSIVYGNLSEKEKVIRALGLSGANS
jgi:circadian clock protein KaiB